MSYRIADDNLNPCRWAFTGSIINFFCISTRTGSIALLRVSSKLERDADRRLSNVKLSNDTEKLN